MNERESIMNVKNQIRYLQSPRAIREQCKRILILAEQGRLTHFQFHPENLTSAVNYVADHIKANYPKLDIPYHSRWRHFDESRLQRLAERLKAYDSQERARIQIELAIISVLLDAGAGMSWRYQDSSARTWKLSEGLAAASFDLFLSGRLSPNAAQHLQVDAEGLKALDSRALAAAFQVTANNPLQGFEGRLQLLQTLAQTLAEQTQIFGPEARLGRIYDAIISRADGKTILASDVLDTVLKGLGSIWPGRVMHGGVNLGDVWPHQLLPKDDLGGGLLPFHKLSQWLTYSLIEPLEQASYQIVQLDELTGLAEYRNGGLLIDLAVISPKDPAVFLEAHRPDSELIVEWRALTVSLLDQLAEGVRKMLGKSTQELPLAKVLQGGTWSAGRLIAASKRSDGGPPLRIVSDGTVF